MRKFKENDLIGPEENFLIKSIDFVKNKRTYGTVICPLCGQEFQWVLSDINRGRKKNCGCQKNYCFNDITNQVFNNLLVLERTQRDNIISNHGQRALWKVECLECKQVLKMDLYSLKRGDHQPCPHIKGTFSKGETKISLLLQELQINFETQKTFNSCRFSDTNAMARFDFYLPDYKTLIEFNGQQHYSFTNSGWNTEEAFKTTIEHDKFKQQWSKENQINLITISYIDFDILTTEYLLNLLSNNKINNNEL